MRFARFLRRHPWLWRFATWAAYLAAYLWRRLMFRTTFIAITGSVGKTTAKECAAAILSARFPTVSAFDTQNRVHLVARTILRTRYRHRFAVLEAATDHPGYLWKHARLIRPHVAVILSVARTHTQSFPSLEDTAAEKARLLDALRPEGVAVLNGDDPRVLAMAARFRGRAVIFGRSPEFDLWASEVSARWPARLSFRVHAGSESLPVNTQLVGQHWLASVLASLAVAQCCGVDLESAISVLAKVEPHRARMEPAPLPSGAILLRDDFNGSFDTLTAALEVLAQAQADRRVLVLSDVSDSRVRARDRAKRFGEQAARCCDLAIFLGEHRQRAVKSAVRCGMPPENVYSFATFPEAAAFLESELREGDLALLRGRTTDHLGRVYFAQLGSVGCILARCPRLLLCDHCFELRPGLEKAQAVPAPVRPFWQPLV